MMSEEEIEKLTGVKVVLWDLCNSMDDVQQYAQKRVLMQEVEKIEELLLNKQETKP